MHKSILLAIAASLLVSSAIAAPSFSRIASFPVELNVTEDATSAEIIAASDDGMTLVYSDSPGGGIGFVDITDAELRTLCDGIETGQRQEIEQMKSILARLQGS